MNRKNWIFDSIVWSASLLCACVLLTQDALADSKRFTATNETWKAECGSCHVAYPPNLLPAAGWRRILEGMDKHFGTDARVDAGPAAEIGAFLERNAGSGKRGADSGTLRVTETPWFKRKHDEAWYRREGDAAATPIWKHTRIQSASNCAACHPAAERGDFDEHAARIPR